ncbi:NRPS-like enzyme, putative [Talaromyces stipitatus ATCC 10500]|uniref:NRPS-like enzyme, putative n=1 Tax=Talaromyces stipitatus (strain ATCC 10500 / CBS 375.48 / QM 6759 / NRRL 1006) TaxID=441959 RepID=B8LYS2_TALSN|nr:NRPS-like enzyme, putative [Talaromyces stipitatus ATCC 10500]EED23430.1 NRPS-like enzyme, putative [Talaromyces stipitatus ATCC 10500]
MTISHIMTAIVQTTPSDMFQWKQSSTTQHIETVAIESPKSQTIDGLIRHRAKLLGDTPLVFYPHTGIEYVGYSMRQLDIFAFRVAQKLALRLPPRTSSSEKPIVVSLLGPSNLNYLVTFWALSKLGHSVLFLSTRISLDAYASLLERTESEHIVIAQEFQDTAKELTKRLPGLQINYIATDDWYNFPIEDVNIDTNLTSNLDPAQETAYVSWIIHSSGSTGLPKPIFQTHKAALGNYAQNMNMRGFITLPLYHNYGISCLHRSVYSCKSIHLYSSSLPLARQYLLRTMQANDFEIFYSVPYTLKLLSEVDEGIQSLRKCKVVLFSGSPCPDSLGDRLVTNGVHLVSQHGSTETGQLMTSDRPREDKLWNYLRPGEAVKPFLRFEERSPGLYEAVVLDGWPSKVLSNRPDGSYATKDLFMKHPEMEAYKYFARLDDTIVLMNGEKVIPLALEGSVRQDPLVAEVLVFGAQKARIEAGAALSRDQVIEQIWSRIGQAQSEMPAFGQLSRNMVVLLPPNTQYPRTDKGTVIRQAAYRQFADLIENAYDDKQSTVELETLPEPELRRFLEEQLRDILPAKSQQLLSEDADFFNIGMDSLQATQLRSIISRCIDTGGKELGLNVAFDHPTIKLLAQHLISLRSGFSDKHGSVEDAMRTLIEKYSVFQPHIPLPNGLEGRYIVITGTSGSLGSHTAANLALQSDVRIIYCLIRAGSTMEAYERLAKSLRERRLYDSLSDTARSKLVALPVNLSDPRLGFDEHTYNLITSQITDLIHCAWSVNFNWQLASFEKDNIAGVKNLIDLCLKSQRPTPASFNFCSSISAIVNTAENEIPEALPNSLSYAQEMGYAQSKLVAEHICQKAAEQTGLRARVLRIGQVIGDTQHGIWNTTEAIPLMIQSATTIGALPRLNEIHRWLPADTVAQTIIDHSFSTYNSGILNIVNHNSFHWTHDLIHFLHQAGLQFTELETSKWLEKLRASNPDPAINPPIKLIEFWTTKYGSGEGSRKSFVWRTELARRYSKTLNETKGLGQNDVTKMVQFFKTVW